jgi:hypothetical protein
MDQTADECLRAFLHINHVLGPTGSRQPTFIVHCRIELN